MIKVGDKVAYSVQFLSSIGMSHGEMAHARGLAKKLIILGKDVQLAAIEWDCDMSLRVNVVNLAKVGLNTKFSRC